MILHPVALLSLMLAQSLVPEQERAIQRALPYVERGGLSWIKEKKCTTCHRVSLMIWSTREAARRGVRIDRSKLDKWVAWARSDSLKKDKKGAVAGLLNLDGLSQLVLSRGTETPTRSDDPYVKLIRAGQRANGS